MILKKFTKVILIGVWCFTTAAFTSCVDDHFDIADDPADDGIATQTLWELISNDASLSNFAKIAAMTPAFKDEKHPIQGYTFKDVFSGQQVLTVFAPDNDAFTSADVLEYEALIKSSPYDAFLRLVGNHVTRGRYVATGMNPEGKAERIIFINNKQGIFDRVAKTIKDVPLKNANLKATNGVLHVIGEQIPFAYNIFEYIRAMKGYDKINNWISQHDTLYFNADLSAIAGTNPETGEPIYVDSVYSRSNTLYLYRYEPQSVEWVMPHKGIAANIEQEDSIWAMVLPSDAAWEEAAQTMQPWYTYANEYYDMEKEDAKILDETKATHTMLTVSDTIQEAAISMDIVSPLVFNVRMQRRIPEQTDFWTVESFLKHKITKLFNTRTDTFIVDKNMTTDVRELLCEGKDPIEVSNGLIYPVNHWNFRKTYEALNVEVKAHRGSIFQNGRYNLTSAEQNDGKHTYFGNYTQYSVDNTSALVQKYGIVSKNGSFLNFNRTSGRPKATFKLMGTDADQQVLSGIDYQIGIVMVPDFYISLSDPEEYPDAVKKSSLQASITYTNTQKGGEKTWSSKAFDYDGERVDTIWLEDSKGDVIQFPFSYRNLSKAYPYLTIESRNITQKMEREGYQRSFSIDKIILRPKNSEE